MNKCPTLHTKQPYKIYYKNKKQFLYSKNKYLAK